MKRSQQITLVLSGAMATWPLGCEKMFGPSVPLPPPPVTQSGNLPDDAWASQLNTTNSYTNNHYVPSAGYYHAPYRGWFPYPYNYQVPGHGFFHGGMWSPQPHQSVVNASQPAGAAVDMARERASGLASSSGGSGYRGGSSSGFSRSGSSSGTSRGGFGSSSQGSGS